MPKIDFNKVGDAGPLPDGEYFCRIERVERSQSQYGDEMWKVRLAVQGGPHAGRVIYDNLTFSAESLPRVKLLCACIRLDLSGELDLTPDMLRGRDVRVRVGTEKYQSRARNKVFFDGYAPAEGATPFGGSDAEDADDEGEV